MKIVLAVFVLAVYLGAQTRSSTSENEMGKPNQKQNGGQYRPGERPIPAVPLSAEPRQTRSPPDAAASKTQPQKPRWGKIIDYICESFTPSNLSNWCLCLFAAIAAGIALRTLSKMDEQSSIARDTLLLTHRPKFVVREVAIVKPSRNARFISLKAGEYPFGPDTEIEGILTIVNQGNTRGSVTASLGGVYHGGSPEGLPMRPPHGLATPGFGSFVPADTVLNPGERSIQDFRGTGPSAEQLARHNTGKTMPGESGRKIAVDQVNSYVFGFVEYRDDLGTVRRVAFCRHYREAFDKFVAIEDPDYEYAD